MAQPLNITIYLDYICPWCYVASTRLLILKEEYREKVTMNWKSFLLDPYGLQPKYSVERLNEGRLRAGREENSLQFEPWPENKPLPDSSIPAHKAAKCAQIQGAEFFERYQMALMKAYSSHCRDIADRQVLISLAEEVRLDVKKFISDFESEWPLKRVLAEREEGVQNVNVIGVPTVVVGGLAVLEAAVPLEVYKQAVRRLGMQK
jgi:predicted DsbA family dithiol-disulfide isomerase